MSYDKVNKIKKGKNFIAFGVLFLIIFCIIHFNISIGFTVFENIENIPLIIVINIKVIIIIVIIVVIVIIFVHKLIKSRSEIAKKLVIVNEKK